MSFDAEKLIAQQNKEREKEEARVAQMRLWDAPTDEKIILMNISYLLIAMVFRFYLAEFFNFQQLDPGRPTNYKRSLDYGFINASFFFMLGPADKTNSTWKDMWRPAQYVIALVAYLTSTYLRYRSPPPEFHEPQIIQMFMVFALILDMILVLIYWIHTYRLFRRKYLPDCLALTGNFSNWESWLMFAVMFLFMLSSHWFGAFVAPGLPKYFH